MYKYGDKEYKSQEDLIKGLEADGVIKDVSAEMTIYDEIEWWLKSTYGEGLRTQYKER